MNESQAPMSGGQPEAPMSGGQAAFGSALPPEDRRPVQAVQQIVVALAIVGMAWLLASVLTPEPTLEGANARSLLAMPFIATCCAIVALFTMNAVAFDRSQLPTLGPVSPMAGVTAGALWFVGGVLTIDTFGLPVVMYLFFAAIIIGSLVAAVGVLMQLLIRSAQATSSP